MTNPNVVGRIFSNVRGYAPIYVDLTSTTTFAEIAEGLDDRANEVGCPVRFGVVDGSVVMLIPKN